MTKQSVMSRYHRTGTAGEQAQRGRRTPTSNSRRGCWSRRGHLCTQRARAWPSWGPGPSPDRDVSPQDTLRDWWISSQKASFTPFRTAPL